MTSTSLKLLKIKHLALTSCLMPLELDPELGKPPMNPFHQHVKERNRTVLPQIHPGWDTLGGLDLTQQGRHLRALSLTQLAFHISLTHRSLQACDSVTRALLLGRAQPRLAGATLPRGPGKAWA